MIHIKTISENISQFWRLFWVAVMLYTRLPALSFTPRVDDTYKSIAFLPLIGVLVGALMFLILRLAEILFLPLPLSLSIALIGAVVITGAFHEDGLADAADGLLGVSENNSDKVLAVMKDSRIGAFGVIALIANFSLKLFTLYYVCELVMDSFTHQYSFLLMLIFINYHTLARLACANIVFSTNYADKNKNSKFSAVARSQDKNVVLLTYVFGLVPLFLLAIYSGLSVLLILLPLLFWIIIARNYFINRIGGYTGDCLGASEQFSEWLVLVSLLMFFSV